jgi:hypothetical protein
MTSTTPPRKPRLSVPPLSAIAGQGLRIVAVAGRAVTICLLTPIVLVCGVAAFLGLAVVGSARMAQARAASLSRNTRAAAADVQFYASSAAEHVESVAARQAA